MRARGQQATQKHKTISRLLNEAGALSQQNIPHIQFSIIDENVKEWLIVINGPENTPYEGGIFFVKFMFPDDYPHHPPKIQFKTIIFHCNVGSKGSMQIEAIIKKKWSPVDYAKQIVYGLIDILSNPCLQYVSNKQIADLYINQRQKHDQIASLV
eukprot:TRINITY_DN9411_c0_g5_i1.p1 TRINITY_DN9411_c0_g5~~TRINITY_DN9411_c0_g5_i1.p1  ORF type:complete len:177 (-),score=8.20 TRINITY_DN9411_c0_g5_i1:56-520(-)